MTTDLPELALRSQDAGWNRERWERLPEDGNRYEVIDGVLYMTTAPSAFHQWIIRQIVRILFVQIDDAGIGITLWSPLGLFMPGCDPVQPDIIVIRTENLHIIHDRRITGIPALLVEVLSPSNPTQDTETKRKAYARAGVPEYWIVRPASRDLLLCTQPDAALGDYAGSDLIAPDGTLVSPTLPVRTPIARFFADAPDTTW
mgnify:CR=1 FL=1